MLAMIFILDTFGHKMPSILKIINETLYLTLYFVKNQCGDQKTRLQPLW